MVDKCECKVPKSRNYITEWPFVPWPFFRVAFRPVAFCRWPFVPWPYVRVAFSPDPLVTPVTNINSIRLCL